MGDHDTANMDKHTDAELREGIERADEREPRSERARQAQEEQRKAMEHELEQRGP